jgi:3-polyprenyl-4-hydroxybenzoate decarboxylase
MGQHWKMHGQRNTLQAAIVIASFPPGIRRTAKLPYDFDEYRLAGGLAGEPVSWCNVFQSI